MVSSVMKVINAQRASRQADMGGSMLLDYAVYFEAPLKETIDVCILFSPDGQENQPKLWGSFQLWLKDFDGRWFDQFWMMFTSSQVFRQQVKKFYGIAGANQREEHAQTINHQLHNAVRMLGNLGFKVNDMGSGGTQQSTFIEAEQFPKEVIEASNAAGFRVEPQRIAAGGLVCQPIANLQAGGAFAQLMADWAEGGLKPGHHYAGWHESIRTCSLVPSSIKVTMLEKTPQVARAVEHSLNGTLAYHDLAKLRSGRDYFSKINMDTLLSNLQLTEVPEITSHLDEADQRKVLRWMCRGLHEGMAIQKVLIDNVATEQQRQRSKQARAHGRSTGSTSDPDQMV